MIDGNKVLAIIPARGGSKGIPRKNIASFCGKPLIAWSIEEALRSKYIDRVIVSTEDKEIGEVSQKYGAEVPFLRPVELSQDDTPGIDPILHCIKWLKLNEKCEYDYICTLQCTSPFRNSEHIDEALEKLLSNKGDSIVSISESEVSPYWMKKIKHGKLVDFIKNIPTYTRRQDLPKVYKINGALYMIKTSTLLKNKSWYSRNTLPYIMNRVDSIDIDEPIDLKIAEILMKERLNCYE